MAASNAARKVLHMILFLELAGLALSTAAHVVRAVRRA